MSVAVILALGAAVGYGLGDFLGGLYTRRVGLIAVLVIGQAAGLVVLAAGVLVIDPVPAGAPDLAWGALGGTAAVVGGWLLLHGFREGRLSVVSPVSSVGAAGIPLGFDLALGTRPSLVAIAGIGLGLGAIWLIGAAVPDLREGRSAHGGLWYGLGAGVCFAAMYLALDRTDPTSGIWPVLSAQAATVLLAIVAAVLLRRRPVTPARMLPGVASTGVASALATLCFLLAARAGLVSIAALVASLSPAVTVVLARLVLAEHLPRRQITGLVTAAGALVLIGLG